MRHTFCKLSRATVPGVPACARHRKRVQALFARDAGDAITFWGQDGDKRIRCRISREALDDHFSNGDRLKPEAAFKKHRKEIEALARRKYQYGEREPDGSVLLRTLDIA